MEFKDVFQILLKRSGITQAEFCRRSGLSTAYVSQINTGKNADPSISKAKKMANTFGITLQELSDMMDEEQKSSPKGA